MSRRLHHDFKGVKGVKGVRGVKGGSQKQVRTRARTNPLTPLTPMTPLSPMRMRWEVHHKKILLSLFLFGILLSLAGCAGPRASIKPDEPRLRTFMLGRCEYVPLSSICRNYELDPQWDSLTKTVTLIKPGTKLRLRVGSNFALLNGKVENIGNEAKLYEGFVVVPATFGRKFPKASVSIPKYKRVKPSVPTPVHLIRTVVVDPGHGGKDPGAIGRRGSREKDINLAVAKQLKAVLAGRGIRVILTRSSDKFISLRRRTNIANDEKADFFISIHANASRMRSASGFEVYYLSEAIDDYARAVEEAENASLKFENISIAPSTDLQATLWDIIYAENRAESIELANCVTKAMARKLGVRNRGVKAARFYVLKGANMPAVLIEVGFISNRYEEARLRSSSYIKKAADAIARGVLSYKREYEVADGFTR